ncbi:hypothetical protein BBO99_00009316 [Phytophthora kernoviae]|uniref:Apple domain-containing protein n=2 Tax=Phytophthora kernoviae TaxID=325452 RepID=A0A421ETD0_9STRA|nr:hypothetical protein G195_009879 [Phytophthora kernoviae 00238/432]KAG2505736.1 hypothetical protein JM18_009479 [Phytophthora kernoviae]KAG2510968.1 hypothetical protein JM16_008320 [Phytophthora kernoviae]RLM97635.1 hypothetical protein BBI17_008333 [Phytophthora kernoviae]RLN73589.1 hypothetical protein BBO99_00009316 [Phytophthora kernoviae]
MLARVFTVLASLAAVAAGDCASTFGNCGSDSAGANCCQSNQYCQPWNSNYYQCLDLPANCTQQFPNIDFNGDDLETIYGLQPGECCTKCSETSGCKAYTFVNNNPGRPACYLKKGTGTRKSSPWNDNYYQCIQPPSKCAKQRTDTDFYGNDIKTVYVSLPSLCCDACASTSGCKAYTYINNNPGQPVCYLKSSAGTTSTKIGAVSGILN